MTHISAFFANHLLVGAFNKEKAQVGAGRYFLDKAPFIHHSIDVKIEGPYPGVLLRQTRVLGDCPRHSPGHHHRVAQGALHD